MVLKKDPWRKKLICFYMQLLQPPATEDDKPFNPLKGLYTTIQYLFAYACFYANNSICGFEEEIAHKIT